MQWLALQLSSRRRYGDWPPPEGYDQKEPPRFVVSVGTAVLHKRQQYVAANDIQ